MALAGLQATLEAYRDGEAASRLPALAMLTAPAQKLKRRASRLRSRLRRGVPEPWRFELKRVESRVGGGALPRASLPSWAVTVEHPEMGADAIEPRLRRTEPPVIARIEEDRLLLDVRTVADEQVAVMVEAVTRACSSKSRESLG
jgi:L-seryl-tRNA(Ser) seleniumtransferase